MRADTMRACVNAAVMPLSLKLPEGFMPSYWSQQAGGIEADVAADLIGGLEEGLAFADGDDQFGGSEGEEFAETPDAGEVEGVGAVRPLGLELVEAAGDGEAVPVVDNVDQIAANRAGEMSLVDREGGRPGGVDALLKGGIAWQIVPAVVLAMWPRTSLSSPSSENMFSNRFFPAITPESPFRSDLIIRSDPEKSKAGTRQPDVPAGAAIGNAGSTPQADRT